MARAQSRPAESPSQAEVLTKAALKACEHLELSSRILARIFGVSEATISRLRNGQRLLEPNEKSFELAVLFVRLYRALDAIVGGDDAVAAMWLRNENTALNDRPLNLIQSLAGLMHVIQYLDARRALI
jgi:transcriptional regulator with XRE-family HTH domain